MILDRLALRQTIQHPTPDSPKSQRAYHKGCRCCPAWPDNPGIVPDRPIHSRTVRLHRSDRPEHQKSPVIRLVWKADINIADRPSPKRQKSHLSLRLFGPLRPNLMFALTRTREKVKFTFNITKCDKIFDELLKHSNIKLSHIIPSVEELKGRVHCKCIL